MGIIDWLRAHPIQVTLWCVVAAIITVRTLFWQYRPWVACETCECSGRAHRVIRGSFWVELAVLAHGLTVGLIAIELLWFTIVFFLWRTLGSYLTCAHCGSERIEKRPWLKGGVPGKLSGCNSGAKTSTSAAGRAELASLPPSAS